MKIFRSLFPLLLCILVFFFLSITLFLSIHILNLFPTHDKILPVLFIGDILVGLTIYLKTSVDFAIFIGNLMHKNPGVKNRIAIEIGTALGNGLGTIFVLIIWTFFKEVPLLLVVMILLAALVLFSMSEEGLTELTIDRVPHIVLKRGVVGLKTFLHGINALFSPIIKFIIPRVKTDAKENTFLGLFLFSCTIPLILGLDDFAGYIPLFSIVNVFGFAVGVFLGHAILTIALFASPTSTTRVVRHPVIVFLGSLAFLGIGLWGIWEAVKIVLLLGNIKF